MYEGAANQGMRCIREILSSYEQSGDCIFQIDTYDVRGKAEVPGLDYTIYICTGGPGSPVDSEGTRWEAEFFDLVDKLYAYNRGDHDDRKYVFFICHSFQMICRHWKLGEVVPRRSTSFGVLPVHKTLDGMEEVLFSGLTDPFYVVDSRDWQVIQPDMQRLEAMGAQILALEKIRPHVPLERCIMAMRFSPEFFGTQFHPEADSSGMTTYLLKEEKRKTVVENHGLEKYHSMIEYLGDPDKIQLTQSTILPGFLDQALQLHGSGVC